MNRLYIIMFMFTFILYGCDSMTGELPIHQAAKKGSLIKIQEIITHNPKLVNAQDNLRRTPLYFAASQGHKHVVEFLLANGADIELGNHLDERPLAKSAKFGHYDVVLILLEHGANVNVQDNFGQTPLHEATGYGFSAVVEVLVTHGANMFLKNSYGETPRDLALKVYTLKPELIQFRELAQYLEKKEIELQGQFKDAKSENKRIVTKEWIDRCLVSYHPDCKY